MTVSIPENQDQSANNIKEMNFRKQEQAIVEKYERQLAAERLEREKLSKELEQRNAASNQEEDDDSEPYVDKKRLNKQLQKFGQSTQSEIQKAMEVAKQTAKQELKEEMWLDNNPDFYETLKLANKFAEKAPRLAESILRMPEGFERQKLVYENIKSLGLDKPEQKQPSIQEKVDANRRSPYYQPSGVGTAPYSSQSDFSSQGQKQAWDKMQELKNRLRI